MRILSFILLLALFISCQEEAKKQIEKEPIIGLITENAMIVSAREEASKIGVGILQKGGNAFDAMIAMEMALAVSYPYAGNLGGGGFMVYRTQYGELGSLDYREKAPIKATKNMYQDQDGNIIPDISRQGPMAVGVPGTVAGIFAVHKKLGSLPMEEILQPVIELANYGYTVTEKQARRLAKYREAILDINGESSLYTDVFQAGDTIKNQALASTLRRIATNGRSEFYQGETAESLIDFIESKGGILSLKDLNAYEAVWREPIIFKYKELKIISMAPPSSGGICMGQILKMVEPYPISEYGHNSIKTIQVMAEAERMAYADRSYYLGDPDFVDIPVDTLLADDYLFERMSDFSFDHASPSENIQFGSIQGYESSETTHYSIVDSLGNAAAITTTLNSGYGSKLYVNELGFFLNNEMDDFSSKPGEPNVYGLLGAEANSIAPQKRMLSSMSPTIVEKDGDLWMVLGTPGGATIITSVVQTILNVYEHGMSMQEAVNAPRFHHQWLPDAIRYEFDRFPTELIQNLKYLGYPENIKADPTIGIVDAILVLKNKRLEGGADPRGDDTSIGF